SPANADTDRADSASVTRNGLAVSGRKNQRVPATPSLTARVVLPDSAPEAMSRRLFVTSTPPEQHQTAIAVTIHAHTMRHALPTTTAVTIPAHSTRPACTISVPITATRPKKTNTAISPKPA